MKTPKEIREMLLSGAGDPSAPWGFVFAIIYLADVLREGLESLAGAIKKTDEGG